jgi:predicted membrane-bound spermidine synthase
MCTKLLFLGRKMTGTGVSGWRTSTVLAGTITAGTQIVLLREVLCAFLGNELVIGIMLFDWLALTGVGALLAARRAAVIRATLVPPVVLGLLLVLPPLTFIGFRVLPLIVAPVGSMVDISIFLVGAVIVLSPVCLASGAAFALLVYASTNRGVSVPVGTVYAWEGVGSLIGGILFGILLFDVVSSPDLLLWLCLGAGLVGLVLAFVLRERYAALVLFVLIASLPVAWWNVDVEGTTFRLRYPNHKLLAVKETPFGLITATEAGDQTELFANNIPLFVNRDIQNAEETIHPVLAQQRGPLHVLLAGGNPAGLVPEILKYPGSTVVSLEENGWLRETERKFLHLPHGDRIQYTVGDLRQHLGFDHAAYTSIVIVAPEPSSLQANRLYTREMMQIARKGLARNGILCLSLPSSEEYSGSDARNVRTILRNTMLSCFRNVIVLPLGRDIFLGSDSTLRIDVAAAIAGAGVPTTYANESYIQDDLLAMRVYRMSSSLQRTGAINTDNHPVLMLAQIQYWIQFFSVGSWIPALVFVAALLFLIRFDRVSLGMLSAGCSGMTLELMVLMILQVGIGNMYKLVGAFLGVYMAGMSIGAFVAGRISLSARRYAAMQCGLAIALVAASMVQPYVSADSPSALAGLVVSLVLGSFCAGGVFAFTSRLKSADPVVSGSRMYAVDLLGSAIGALSVGPFLLPLLGVQAVASSAAGLAIIGAAATLTSPLWRLHEKA